ncbi:hypothetical protein SADUNF_Sadunf08G0053300 [Salix dunnii]|uniref:Uncharacterized protein n=4 Tax=Salix TaxID=40685 RepID=A0A835JUY6_9ROSI|nr:hypothetical protein SADUNF_Sadunf08G0053300 [Salix dunnii]
MNRSFRAQDSQMQMQAAVVKQRQQLRATMMKEKEEELALFLEMKKREKEQNNLLLFNNTEDFEAPFGSRHGNSPIFNISSSTPARKTGADDFLNSENDKHDYDWLLSPPGTPLFPSLEMESQKTIMSQNGTSKARPTALKSRLASPQPEPSGRGSLVSKQSASSPGLNSSGAAMRRPSSSGGPGSRPSTPTGCPTVTTGSKPSRSSTPTSRATLSSSKPTVSAAKPTVSAAKSTTSSTNSTVPARSSTPSRSTTRSATLTRSTTRSSTPTARPSIPPSKLTSRAATPTRRLSTPYSSPSLSAPTVTKSVSLSAPTLTKSAPAVTKSAPTAARNPVPSRGSSPTVKSRPWKPSEMPGFSLDAPPNLRTSVSERPLSATRGRPGAPSSRSSSVEPTNGRPRRQSCSPSRGRGPNGILHPSGSSVPAFSRGHSKINDNVSPVVIGTKMVDRVINMRKLAPPKQDDKHSPRSLTVKSSSPDSSGFGRTLSKKSLDMAIRHMDIRRIIPGNLRPSMTNIPASSMYSVRSGPTRSRTVSVSDSPLATSSNASSEVSVNNNGLCLDGIGLEDDIGSERGGRSPLRGR